MAKSLSFSITSSFPCLLILGKLISISSSVMIKLDNECEVLRGGIIIAMAINDRKIRRQCLQVLAIASEVRELATRLKLVGRGIFMNTYFERPTSPRKMGHTCLHSLQC